MKDFENEYTSSPRDEDINPQQNDQSQSAQGYQPQGYQPAQDAQPQGYQATGYQPQQGYQAPYQTPQSEQSPYRQSAGYRDELQTPYQTPVQHPTYRAPQQRPDGTYDFGQPDTMQPPRKKKHGMKKVAIALCGVAGACLLFAGGAAIGHLMSGGVSGLTDAQSTMSSSSQPATLQISSTPDYDPDNYDVVNGLAG
jgi:serine protease Do